MHCTLTPLAGALLLSVASFAEIPSYIPVCKRSDPKLNECIIKSIETLRPKLVEGVPELDIPSIEPLILPKVVVSNGPSFKALGRDVIVRGASNFKIVKLKHDLDNLGCSFKVAFPYLSFDANYDVDMQILAVNIKGNGPIKANISQVTGDVVMKGHRVKSKGVEHAKFDSMDLRLHWADYDIRIENLFNGDKILNEAVNNFIRENRKEFIRMVIPFAERVAADLLLDIANKIASHFSYQELFPE